LRLDLSQSVCQGRSPRRVRSPLREDIFSLQIKSLPLPFPPGAVLFGKAPLLVCH
jgi:hypothetical protein